jgi:hypothetical protein
MTEEDDEGLEPIETEPLTGSDEVDDSLMGIDTDAEFRSGDLGGIRRDRSDS